MASPGRSAGRVSVRVVPDSTGFRADLKKILERAERSMSVQIPVTIDGARLREQVVRMREQVERVRPSVQVEGDFDKLRRSLDVARRRLTQDPAKLQLDLQLERAERELHDFRASFGTGPLTVDVQAQVDEAQRTIDHLRRETERKKLELDIGANLKAKKLRAEVAAASRRRFVEFVARINTASLARVGTALAAISGGRVVTDRLKSIGTYLSNLDRNVPKLAAVALAVASIGAAGLSSIGGLVTLGAGLSSVAGAALAVPGILGGVAVGLGVMVAAMKDGGKVLKDLGPAFASLQNRISAKFWAQAEKPVRSLIGSLLPQLRSGLGRTATQLGGLTGAVAAGVQQAFGSGQLTGMLNNLNTAINRAKAGAAPLAGVFATLGTVGSAYLPRLADGFVTLASRLDAFLAKAANDGRLTGWISAGVTALGQLGSALGSAGSILSGLFQAAESAGGGGLASFAATLQTVANIINGPAFQGALTTLFAGAGQAMAQLSTALVPIGNLIATLAPALAGVMTTAGTAIAGLLTNIASALSQPAFATGLTAFFAGIAAGLKAIGPALPAVATALGALGQVAGTIAANLGVVLAAALQALAPVLVQVAAAVGPLIPLLGSVLVAAFQAIVPVLGPLVTALVSGLMPVITALVPIIQQLAPFIASLAGIFLQLVPPVLQIVTALVTGLLPVIQQLTPVVLQIGQALVSVLLVAFESLLPIIPQLMGALTQLVPVLSANLPLFTQILAAVTPLIPVLFELVGSVLSLVSALLPLASAMVAAAAPITGVLIVALKLLVAIVSSSLGTISGLLQALAAVFQGNFSKAGAIVQQTMTKARATIDAATGGMLSKISSFVAGAISKVVSFGSSLVSTLTSAWNRAKAAVTSGVSSVIATVGSLPGKAKAALGSVASLLYSAGSDLVSGFVNGISGAIGRAASAAARMAASAVAAAKGALGINSPSRVFATIGKFVGQGLVKGLTGSRQNVADASKKLAGYLTDAFDRRADKIAAINKRIRTLLDQRAAQAKKVGRIEDQLDSRGVSAKQRRNLNAQLDGAKARLAQINREIHDQQSDRYTLGSVSARTEAKLLAKIKTAQSKLAGIAAQREKLADRIKAATARLNDAIKLRDDYNKSVRESVQATGNITDFQTSSGATDPQYIIEKLKAAVEKANAFRDMIKKLKAQGLSNEALKQIVDAGVDGGSSTAAALLEGGKAAIGQVNALQKQLTQTGTDLGKFTSSTFYQAGVDSAAGLLKGLQSQEGKLAKQAQKLAKLLADAVKKALGIKSPSRVFRKEIGQMIPAGIIAGVRDRHLQLEKTMAGLVQTPSLPDLSLSPARLGLPDQTVGATTNGGDQINFYGNVGWDPDLVAKRITVRKRNALAVAGLGVI